MDSLLSVSEVADLFSVSKDTVRRWEAKGKITARRNPFNNHREFSKAELAGMRHQDLLADDPTQCTASEVPLRDYSVVELFAGAGGLAAGLELAGLKCAMLNEIDKDACATLKINRPHWDVRCCDIARIDFSEFAGKVDVVTGGFPCQAFSYAGKKLGLEDTRGTLFYEFARAVKEIKPLICVGENVRGLLTHDGGRTLRSMVDVLEELGYAVLPPQLLKAIHYRVPQKRERLLIVGLRKDVADLNFAFPLPDTRIYTMRDALKQGDLFDCDVPQSAGQTYPEWKKQVMDMVPPGGYWRDLPLGVQQAYMKKSFFLGGGKTGMARRMAWTEPCLTLTCNPAQKQTERCHPEQTRPLTVREYARVQTFADNWLFSGSVSSQYRQIGNAVPVNLARAVGESIVRALNQVELKKRVG